MSLKIEQIIDLISTWRGKTVSYNPIYGGITNQSFKVIVENKPYFVSISSNTSKLLGVNLFNKFHNNKVCAELKLSPKIICFLAKEGAFVSEFFPLPPLSQKSMHTFDVQKRLITTLKKLHNGPKFLKEFDMFNLIKHYFEIDSNKNIVLPDGYNNCLVTIDLIGKVLEPFRKKLMPCHNDLIPENLFDDGKMIYLIDFDYSGQNDPCFDLGNLCVESNFNDLQVRKLLQNYFGQLKEDIVSRTYLHGILSDIGWSLWAFIQDRISNSDFDFNTYGLNRWKRVLSKIDSGLIDKWLQYI